ncbi:hypothetical protein ACHAXR_006720 [Thalassiosira sp. AJA248-18]
MDTQKEMAIHLLRMKQSTNSNNNEWTPFLDMLTHHPLPWTWPESFRQVVMKGTELEHVVEKKVERVRWEYEQVQRQRDELQSSGEDDGFKISYRDYLKATAVVARVLKIMRWKHNTVSHANPWFGVSIVPFNTTLNWGSDANVEFDLDQDNNGEEVITGRAICDVKQGQELLQTYADSVADLVYRYGFAPSDSMEGDVVSIAISDILSIAEEQLLTNENQGGKNSIKSEMYTLQGQKRERSNRQNPTSNIITNLSFKIQALKQSGAIDESPWDGMEDLTAELTKPSRLFLSHLETGKECDDDGGDGSIYDDGGVSKLVGIFLVLLADDEAWERASMALQSIDDDGGNNGMSHEGKNGRNNEHTDKQKNIEVAPSQTDNEDDMDDAEEDDDDESRTDDVTASVLLSSIANLSLSQSMQMKQVALDVGMGGNDPWRALLLSLVHMDEETCHGERNSKVRKLHEETTPASERANSKRGIPWKLIIEVARCAIRHRLNKSLEGDELCKHMFDRFETKPTAKVGSDTSARTRGTEKSSSHGGFEEEELSDKDKVTAINTISVLRDAEKAILEQAMEILEVTSREIC